MNDEILYMDRIIPMNMNYAMLACTVDWRDKIFVHVIKYYVHVERIDQ